MLTVYLFSQRLPRFFHLTLALVLYLLMLYLGTIESTVDKLPGRENWSKLYHLVFYFGLACFLWFGLVRPGRLKISLLVMLAGAIDEFHQYFLPFRQARISDVLLDTAAA
ncbi:MAG: VanZ family protein, partial [Janthinobacterium lividum]